MAIAETQLTELLNKLIDRTKSGTLGWSRSSASGKFQARSGDFVIYLEGDPNESIMANAISATAANMGMQRTSMTIKKLDGKTVHEINQNINALSTMLGKSSASATLGSKINELYSLIANRDDDIEDLLKSLG